MPWEKSLQSTPIHPLIAFAGGGSRARTSRLQRFCHWQQTTADLWYLPNLLLWRDHLLKEELLTATSVRTYLSTVRSAYRQILRSNELRQWLYNQLAAEMPPERKLALLSEFITQLKNAIDPDNAPIKILAIQDEADNAHLWLSPAQVAAIIQAPGLDTLMGLRDTAILALLLCTGIRAAELVMLDIADLRNRLGTVLALKVRAGKGFKQRLVPYGAQDWALTLVDAWLETAGLQEGPAFVGLRKGSRLYLNRQGNPSRLAVNAIGAVLRRYPITIDGRLQQVKPHDLRRTYARQLYLIGTDLTAIQQNLGHEHQDTTLDYIGTLDADYRAPDDAYGTVWLQAFWDRLARKSSFFNLKRNFVQVKPEMLEFDDPFEDELGDSIQVTPAVQGYLFKIWLEGIRPLIWRRFQVPAGISFHALHDIVQLVMGWENFHLYRFTVGDLAFMATPLGMGDYSADERIDPYLQQMGTTIYYEYDFGDAWGHILKLEKQLTEPLRPACLAGKAACPPEDCGGLWVYKEFLRSRKKRSGRVSPKWQEQMGTFWDADAFDLALTNSALQIFWDSQQ